MEKIIISMIIGLVGSGALWWDGSNPFIGFLITFPISLFMCSLIFED
jgi:hypothetical protein